MSDRRSFDPDGLGFDPSRDAPASLPTALPSPLARGLAFVAIIVAGLAGALIGWGFTDLQCDDCSTTTMLGAVLGAALAAGGTAVVAVLVLRAMGEWTADDPRRVLDDDDWLDGPGLT
ncbi:MAG TPA: hypothetical protein VGA13_09900 [Acidimicrobiales bacterium]